MQDANKQEKEEWYDPIVEFAAHFIAASVIFVMLGAFTIGLHFYVEWLKSLNVEPLFVYAFKGLEYFVFATDVVLFVAYVGNVRNAARGTLCQTCESCVTSREGVTSSFDKTAPVLTARIELYSPTIQYEKTGLPSSSTTQGPPVSFLLLLKRALRSSVSKENRSLTIEEAAPSRRKV